MSAPEPALSKFAEQAEPSRGESNQKYPNDTVQGIDPQGFALAFVTTMRKTKGLVHVPSLRTTQAIPRFLSVRWFRLRALTPQDYLAAALLNTPPEDQPIAERIAKQILFPDQHDAQAPVAPTATVTATPAQPLPTFDAASSILGDLAGLDIDFDNLDSFADIDALLDAGHAGEFKSFDLFESLTSGAHSDRAVARISGRQGAPAELEANAIRTANDAAQFAQEQLRGSIDHLVPEDLVDAAEAGFGALMLQEVRQPWELAGAYAGARDFAALSTHIGEILDHGTTRDIGRTLRFLEPHAGVLTGSDFTRFRDTGLARARDLADHAELLDGLGRYLAPAPDLVRQSAVDNVTRALMAARWIEKSFKEPLQERVFEHWADAQPTPPTIDALADLVVPGKRWEQLLSEAQRLWTEMLATQSIVVTTDSGDLN